MTGLPKTDALLLATFEASHKREAESEEAIWRSMPFFAALLALAVAVLPTVYRQATLIDVHALKIAAYTLIGLALVSFLWAGRWFWQVVKPRKYGYLANDGEILSYTQALEEFYRPQAADPISEPEMCPEEDLHDSLVQDELRQFLIDQLAQSNSVNRQNNTAKITARTLVLLWFLLGFLLSFFAQTIILIAEVI